MLVRHVGFSRDDIMAMTIEEKNYYVHLFIKEMEEKKKQQKKQNSKTNTVSSSSRTRSRRGKR